MPFHFGVLHKAVISLQNFAAINQKGSWNRCSGRTRFAWFQFAMIFHEIRYSDVIMSAMAFQYISLPIVYLIVYSGADQIKHQSSASLAFLRGIYRWPMNSTHRWPVTRKIFPLDDVIMTLHCSHLQALIVGWTTLNNCLFDSSIILWYYTSCHQSHLIAGYGIIHTYTGVHAELTVHFIPGPRSI